MDFQPLAIALDDTRRVSALWSTPARPRAGYVLAHGAGAGMTHAFMAAVAEGLAERGIATLRYQFLYMERGLKRPDSPAVAHAAVRAACAEAARLAPGIPLIAGGKSFGGRMTSQAQAEVPLAGVRGLAFLGFPLHASGQPSDERAQHLARVDVPMLFLQGSADSLASPPLLQKVVKGLGPRAALTFFPGADHSFHVPARTGRKDSEVMAEVLDAFARWADSLRD